MFIESGKEWEIKTDDQCTQKVKKKVSFDFSIFSFLPNLYHIITQGINLDLFYTTEQQLTTDGIVLIAYANER